MEAHGISVRGDQYVFQELRKEVEELSEETNNLRQN
jgi:hypothetical protein